MNIHRLTQDLPLYFRATTITAEIRFRLYARKTLMMSFALAVAVIGGVMLNIAAFRALELLWGPVWTPLALAVINFAMAAIFLAWAAFAHSDRDLVLADEMRKTAFAAIEDDLKFAEGGHGWLGGLPSRDAARLMMPILSTIMGAMKRTRKP
jgi:hypothetical protein